VVAVRQEADAAWEQHFSNLDRMIGEEISPSATLTKDLLKSISDELKKISKAPMNKTVEKLIMAIPKGHQGDVQGSPTITSTLLEARATAERMHFNIEEEDVSIYSLALRRLVESPQSVLSPGSDKFLNFIRLFNPEEERTLTAGLEEWLDPLEVEHLRIAATNLLGFLIRPSIYIPISTSAIPNISLIDEGEAFDILKEKIMRPWKKALEKEVMRSLTGLSDVSLAVGEKLVIDTVQVRTDVIKTQLSRKTLPLLPEDLQYLIVNQANCVAASSATRAIHTQLSS
jgi:hypothetical protein